MHKILITGGAGFIGSNFIKLLILKYKKIDVLNLDKLTYAGNLDSLDEISNIKNYKFVQGDIKDKVLVKKILEEFKPMVVVNFAAESHVDRSIDGPEEFILTNINGTFHLLEETRKYFDKLDSTNKGKFRFIQISTDEVYGSLGKEGFFTEKTSYMPNSPYSASKAAADHLARAYYYTYGLPTIVTNCSNNYGPNQFPEKLIPLVILNALERKQIPVYGDGQNIRDWLYVEDHCEALCKIIENGIVGEKYNIGGGNEKTNISIVMEICSILDKLKPLENGESYKTQIVFVKDRPGHDFRYAIDASRIYKDLGWRPKETFETGLLKTVQWYLNNLSWCQKISDERYKRERLGIANKGVNY